MDPDSHTVPGLGLPPSASMQGAPADATQTQPAIAPAGAPSAGSDSIDEEWVNKAKEIVEHTKNDPFLQSKELNKIRAGYLKTRYNKDIKVSEDKA